MIIARIESLILNKSVLDALKRAKAYVSAGADGIMIIVSKNTKRNFQILKKFLKNFPTIPLVAVPSSYNKVTENNLLITVLMLWYMQIIY